MELQLALLPATADRLSLTTINRDRSRQNKTYIYRILLINITVQTLASLKYSHFEKNVTYGLGQKRVKIVSRIIKLALWISRCPF